MADKQVVESVQEPQVVTQSNSEREAVALTELLKGVTEPLAKSQEIAQKEETKRAEILGKVTSRFLGYIFAVAVLVVLLAAVALFKGEVQLTEKIVIALLGFLGGFGFGRGVGKGR
ncbi:hypothetical protein A7E78_04035 [Syntrophotalea acetylenivorans]|uniref:Uncharacterized protein n=1 Tax=Syntrophotalea acetylenivorans TaxID=1842532 RepID=A0A1L3GM99_9BACT|nr:hypothetical protein [Syntrophotalea acetylenivorans]APG27076.1 hypothetical protein A7E78_04035 [Syntrophotalea acetylenivorans]